MEAGRQPSVDGLPGAELVTAGIDDLRAGRDTVSAALARMAAPLRPIMGSSSLLIMVFPQVWGV